MTGREEDGGGRKRQAWRGGKSFGKSLRDVKDSSLEEEACADSLQTVPQPINERNFPRKYFTLASRIDQGSWGH